MLLLLMKLLYYWTTTTTKGLPRNIIRYLASIRSLTSAMELTPRPRLETTSYSLVDDPDSEQAGRIDCYPDSELEELIAAGLDTASDPLASERSY